MKIRPEKKQALKALKSKRRVYVGPYAVFMFECYETLWWQIQEMLRIEQAGHAQAEEEIEAYAPLLPQGNQWKATLMFEIPEAGLRRKLLSEWGDIENHLYINLGTQRVKAIPVGNDQRTTPDGKTSAVHFVEFPFDALQIKWLHTFTQTKQPKETVSLSITHPNYHHQAFINRDVIACLTDDLNPPSFQ